MTAPFASSLTLRTPYRLSLQQPRVIQKETEKSLRHFSLRYPVKKKKHHSGLCSYLAYSRSMASRFFARREDLHTRFFISRDHQDIFSFFSYTCLAWKAWEGRVKGGGWWVAGEGWVGIGARKWICIWKERLAGKEGAGQIYVFLRNFF